MKTLKVLWYIWFISNLQHIWAVKCVEHHCTEWLNTYIFFYPVFFLLLFILCTPYGLAVQVKNGYIAIGVKDKGNVVHVISCTGLDISWGFRMFCSKIIFQPFIFTLFKTPLATHPVPLQFFQQMPLKRIFTFFAIFHVCTLDLFKFNLSEWLPFYDNWIQELQQFYNYKCKVQLLPFHTSLSGNEKRDRVPEK